MDRQTIYGVERVYVDVVMVVTGDGILGATYTKWPGHEVMLVSSKPHGYNLADRACKLLYNHLGRLRIASNYSSENTLDDTVSFLRHKDEDATKRLAVDLRMSVQQLVEMDMTT